MQSTTQDPNGLIDTLLANNLLKNDAALARFMGVQPPVLSKMRTFKLLVGDSFVLRCVEIAGMTLPEVRVFVPSPYAGAA